MKIIQMRGFSIVELMVALLLGSLVSLAAVQLFMLNRQTESLQAGLASVQDQGRFIFDSLSRDLMQTGHSTLSSIEPFAFTGHGGQVGSDGPLYDVLVLNVDNGLDCLGNGSFTGIKKYWVDTTKRNGLFCSEYEEAAGVWSAANTNSESLIENVEAFQVLYGLDLDSPGSPGYGEANVYVTAALANAARRIVSVRFGVLLSSDHTVGGEAGVAPASIDVLDQTITKNSGVNLDDGRLFRVFASTVALRNPVDEG